MKKVSKFSTFDSRRAYPSWRATLVMDTKWWTDLAPPLASSLRSKPFAENQQSTIWSNFWNRLFPQQQKKRGLFVGNVRTIATTRRRQCMRVKEQAGGKAMK
jgi:hypothetical protein